MNNTLDKKLNIILIDLVREWKILSLSKEKLLLKIENMYDKECYYGIKGTKSK